MMEQQSITQMLSLKNIYKTPYFRRFKYTILFVNIYLGPTRVVLRL